MVKPHERLTVPGTSLYTFREKCSLAPAMVILSTVIAQKPLYFLWKFLPQSLFPCLPSQLVNLNHPKICSDIHYSKENTNI